MVYCKKQIAPWYSWPFLFVYIACKKVGLVSFEKLITGIVFVEKSIKFITGFKDAMIIDFVSGPNLGDYSSQEFFESYFPTCYIYERHVKNL